MGFVQSTTSATTSIALNGVAAGNTLVLMVGWYRDTGTDAVFPTPTDSNGTVAVATSPAPADDSLNAHDGGAAIFYVTNANAGTHTFTLNSANLHATLVEFSSMTASSFDVAANARTQGSSSAISQVTGTTGVTAQANEIVVIACSLVATSGGTSDVGWTDPVPGYTTLQKTINISTDLPVLHAWKEINAVGTQAETFNWTTGNATGYMQAAIATFAEAAASVASTMPAMTSLTRGGGAMIGRRYV